MKKWKYIWMAPVLTILILVNSFLFALLVGNMNLYPNLVSGIALTYALAAYFRNPNSHE